MADPALLRHLLATLAYRGARCCEGAPAGFQDFDSGGGRTALVILAHVGDLLEWALSMAQGQSRWQPAAPAGWEPEVARFHAGLEALDGFLASGAPLQADPQRLLQGPLADALTHLGQLAMMRRQAGAPCARENFYLADVQTGRVGRDQAPARKPF